MHTLDGTQQGQTPMSRQFTVTKWWLAFSFAILATLLSACGGGGGGGATNQVDSSEVLIGLTDAKGDFATYTIDVTSLTLTRNNGQVVEALPLNTRVDFAQYTDLTEFLTAATVPNGVYVKADMTLDYSNANIQVEDADGKAIAVTNILDDQGMPLTTLQASVKLEGRNKLPVAPGIPASLTLDFDLKQTNTVTFDADDVPSITVSPILIAEVNSKAPKRHRVRGPLKNVEVDKERFSLSIRPFRNKMSTGARDFGTLKVYTSDETVFEIDGNGFSGADGLAELALQTENTAVIARGIIQFAPRRFIAKEVYAGSSVPGGDLDVVRGSVMARSGDALTVRGATLVRQDGSTTFSDNITVLLDDTTTVRKQMSIDTFNIDDISVGQRITIFGSATDNGDGSWTIDAANGYARMLTSVARGSVVNVVSIPETPPAFPFVLDVKTINGRNVSLYDFSGTGTEAANDARADFYEIDTGSMDTSFFAVDSRVAVGGFVTPFGTAPADFSANTIVGSNKSVGETTPIDDSTAE